MAIKRTIGTGLFVANLVFASGLAFGAGQYGPGASDTEIKIGNTMPYTGPASAYGVIGKSETAYFNMINEQGGVNGRKINFISRDDGYSPPKTVELVRKLVEEDQVLFTFNILGTPPNTAVQGYLNDNKVPQLFVATGADKWNDPKNHPWTIGYQPSYRVEATIYARYILKNLPNAKIAVLYQNDDFGKDYLIGLREGLGNKADTMIIATKTYETTDPTVDSQIVSLQGSGADTLLTAAIPKFAAQAIRKIYDIGWKPRTSWPMSRSRWARSFGRRAPRRRSASSRPHMGRIRRIRSGTTRPNTRNGWRGCRSIIRQPMLRTSTPFMVMAYRKHLSRCSRLAAIT
jgi:branched-chain amino acid transport system substrate-binding protein